MISVSLAHSHAFTARDYRASGFPITGRETRATRGNHGRETHATLKPGKRGAVHGGMAKRQALKIISFNIRHGGGSRITRIQEAIASHAADLVVLPEFRNNPTGATLRSWLTTAGNVHQAAGNTLAPAHNSVLVASRLPFETIAFPELGSEARRCVGVKLGALRVLAFYFAVMEAKRPLFKFIQGLPKGMLKTETLLIGDLNTGCRYWDEGRMDLSLVEEFGAVLGCGWTDVWRQRNPGIREWSWVEPWGRHIGYRLDHALVSPALLPRVSDVRYSHVERETGVSDHSVLVLELAAASRPTEVVEARLKPDPALVS